ncbi:MAG: TrkH family potassium uptake protein [Arachnia sp.]
MRQFIAWVSHPVRIIPLAYLGVIAFGTVLLSLPVATNSGHSTHVLDSAFTSVSALCITGLAVVPADHWSHFGQVVILGLIEAGGFGIVTVAGLLTMLATGRLTLRHSMVAGYELHSRSIGDAWRLPMRIGVVMLLVQSVTASLLSLGFRQHTDSWPQAIWYGVFHAISAFNNAGFALRNNSLMDYVGDPMVILPICIAIIVGGLGFPVLLELWRRLRGKRVPLSVHARLTLAGTVILLVIGVVGFAIFEWNNPGTLGPLDLAGKVWGSVAGGVVPRTAGFNSVDYAQLTDPNIGMQYGLMMVGGGSVGTAGGLKVSTVAIVVAMVLAEVRGEDQAIVGGRAIPAAVQRTAAAVLLLAIAVVFLSALFIVDDSEFTLQAALFEAISAFATVGLSMGITGLLPPESKAVLMMLMFLGRVGIVTVATAFALRQRHRRYSLPEEAPLVG